MTKISTYFSDEISVWINKLGHHDFKIRKKAIKKLSEIKTPRSINPIINQIYREFYFSQNGFYKENILPDLFECLKLIGPVVIRHIIYDLIDSPEEIYGYFKQLFDVFFDESYDILNKIYINEADNAIKMDLIIVWCLIRDERAIDFLLSQIPHSNMELVRVICLYFKILGEKALKKLYDYVFRTFNGDIFYYFSESEMLFNFFKDLDAHFREEE